MYDINVLNEILKLISKTNRHINNMEKQIGIPLGLTLSQAKVIINIDKYSSLTHNHLSKKCNISKSTLSEILDTMEKKDLVERVRCENDRRKVYVNLTPKGSSYRNSLMVFHNSNNVYKNLKMTELEKKLLYILLKKFYNQIK